MNKYIVAGLSAVSLLSACVSFELAPLADKLVEAKLANDPLPLLSDDYADMSVKQAYNIQGGVVRRTIGFHPSIAGYKGALTQEKNWQKFGLTHPVTGVLPKSGLLDASQSSVTVESKSFTNLMVETEIALVFSGPIWTPISDVDGLKRKVAFVAPAIELPDLNFSDNAKLRGVDVIAGNAAAGQFILGKKLPIKSAANIDGLTVTLSKDGNLIAQGNSQDVMESQWKAALWLVNDLVKQGKRIRKGDVLLTGAIGGMQAGEAGSYRADFSGLGEISFTIQ